MKSLENEREQLLAEISKRLSGGLLASGKEIGAASRLLLDWLHYLSSSHQHICAKELLSGAHAAIIEATTFLSLDFGRSAIGAIRTQIDLVLGFTYFGDHPREWDRVCKTGEGFMLYSDILRFHKEMDRKFGERLTTVEQFPCRGLRELYRILSAHIHGQSKYTIPKAVAMTDLLSKKAFLVSVIELQQRTSESLSDFLVALYAPDWANLPKNAVARVRQFLTDKQQSFFQ